jgi:hypothetical protein
MRRPLVKLDALTIVVEPEPPLMANDGPRPLRVACTRQRSPDGDSAKSRALEFLKTSMGRYPMRK